MSKNNAQFDCIRKLGHGPFLRWLAHDGAALMSEISVLIKETVNNSLSPFTMGDYSERMAVCESSSRVS